MSRRGSDPVIEELLVFFLLMVCIVLLAHLAHGHMR